MIFLAQSSTPAKQRCDAALKCTIYICSSVKLWRHKNTAQPDPYFTCTIHTITHDTSITAKHEPRKTPRRTIERVYRDGKSAMRDRSSCVLVLLLILPGSLCDDDHGDLVSDSARYAKKCADWWTELLDLKRATKFVWARPNARSRVSCEPAKKKELPSRTSQYPDEHAVGSPTASGVRFKYSFAWRLLAFSSSLRSSCAIFGEIFGIC